MSLLNPEEEKFAIKDYDTGSSWEACAAVAKIFQASKMAAWHSSAVPVEGFSIQVEESLPPLAWLCETRNGFYNFIIGKGVESGANYIVEGAWDGPFGKAGFGASDHFYGSGAFVNENNICVFVPPRHCADFLFSLHDQKTGSTWISNSFCFIFARADLDLTGDFYGRFRENINSTTNEESALGADRGSPLIASDGRYAMHRLMYHNFTVDNEGHINYLMRLPAKLHVNGFDSYRQFLLETTAAILANGRDQARKKQLGAITMLSTGYDSTATSTICAQCGVGEAVTLDVVIYGHNDRGDKIAGALGLVCHKASSPLGDNVPSLNVFFEGDCGNYLEFFATCGIGDNVVFSGMEKYLGGKIVFSGLYGDGCWSETGNGGGLAHHPPFMKSRNEFRLRVGYCLAPLPAFGAYFPYVLKNVAGDNMAPWSVGGDYDRPIPRRIAEEAGVPRELFGIRKAANNPRILNFRKLFDEAVRHVLHRYQL